MITSKSSNITISLSVLPKAPEIVISLSFKVDMKGCCKPDLEHHNCTDGCFPDKSEELCMCHSLFYAVKSKLCLTPEQAIKNGVGACRYGVHNNHLFINWDTKGNGGALGKTIKIAVKNLNPNSMFPAYSECMRVFSKTPDRDVFNHIAGKFIAGIKSGIHIMVVGKIKLVKEKLDDICAAANALVTSDKPVAGPAGKEHSNCTQNSEQVLLQSSSWITYLLKMYIEFKVKGLSCGVCNDGLVIHTNPSRAASDIKKIANKESVEDFVERHFKFDDDSQAFAYIGIASGKLCSIDAAAFINTNPTKSAIVNAILSHLK